MANLTSKERSKMPAKEFGEPSKRAFPMPDRSHAANAKARASEMEHKGKLSPSMKAQIDRKADAMLAKSKVRSTTRNGKY